MKAEYRIVVMALLVCVGIIFAGILILGCESKPASVRVAAGTEVRR